MSPLNLERQNKRTPRIARMIRLVKPGLPTWDLCCDHGMIGIAVLMSNDVPKVFFMDKQPHIVSQLKDRLAVSEVDQTRIEVLCEDILKLSLSQTPANYIIAGVGTNLIMSFLAKFPQGSGHRIICHTDQNPDRFERLLLTTNLKWAHQESFSEKGIRHHIWVFDI